MGTCALCGKPAGLFRREHEECRHRRAAAQTRIPAIFPKLLVADMPLSRFRQLVTQAASECHLSEHDLRPLVVAGISQMVDNALADHLVTDEESEKINSVMEEFRLGLAELGEAGSKMAKAYVLRKLEAGDLTSFPSEVPNVRLEPNERLIWWFGASAFFAFKKRTQYVGASQGVSIRLAKGVYYKIGTSFAEPLTSEVVTREADGQLMVSSKAVYFFSDSKPVKLPVRKIVAVRLYSDAIHIMRDGVSARPLIFGVDDPAFAAMVIARLP